MSTATGSAVTTAPTGSLVAKPPPNFVEMENGVYYYVAVVSEEDQKKGKVAGDVLGFKFLGKDTEGRMVIASVADTGKVTMKASCSNPCSIIKYETGERVGFNPSSLIGAAFQDAMNGYLVPAGKGDTSAGSGNNSLDEDGSSAWSGEFTGQFEGARGDVTLSTGSGGRVAASISIGADGCAGQISGLGRPEGDVLKIVKPTDDSGNQCRVTIIRRAGVLEVQEETCGYFHGFECSFNGKARKR